MEWVETTGRTVEDAKEAALDQLGVDAQDAEFEVMAEAKGGLFGRLRSEARVRARVRPTQPRPKEDRRERRRRSSREGSENKPRRNDQPGASSPRAAGGVRSGDSSGESTDTAVASDTARRERPRRAPRRGEGNGQREARDAREVPEMTLAEQAEVGREFLVGLVAKFDPAATVEVETVDDDTLRLAVRGGELGLLIGPKGQTLQAIQELVRTVVQRHTTSREGWLVVDVAEYRQKRTAALEKFAQNVATQVLQTGQSTALEPMSPADRKVVHDAVNAIDGVTTTSEGEDPRRHVVIMAAAG
ncbi:MAG: Jag N-terminal domain-containing protein [Actinobacteria bacterium]|nr:Jag N-terminal domain-containing protein [Actinomycetota bacterium]